MTFFEIWTSTIDLEMIFVGQLLLSRVPLGLFSSFHIRTKWFFPTTINFQKSDLNTKQKISFLSCQSLNIQFHVSSLFKRSPYFLQKCSRDRNYLLYLWLICKIVQELEKALEALGSHYFRVFPLT